MRRISSTVLMAFLLCGPAFAAGARNMTVDGDGLLATAKEYVLAGMPWPKEDVVIEADRPGDLDAPQGVVRCAVEASGGGELAGDVTVPVTVYVDGKAWKTVPVRLRVKVFGQAPVAARTIDIHAPLSGGDVVFQRRELTACPAGVPASPQELSGMRARHRIAAGRIVSRDLVEAMPVVRSGDTVTIHVVSGNCEVSTKGIAQEEGKPGDTIRVLNPATKKQLRAEVSEPGNVTVWLQRPAAGDDSSATEVPVRE